jgi:hypothetical protein
MIYFKRVIFTTLLWLLLTCLMVSGGYGVCFQYDLDCDGDVDVSDVMQISSCWNAILGDYDYNAEYDFNGDGAISISDIMMVAASWGWIPQVSEDTTLWADSYGSTGKDKGWAVTVDHQGNILMTGEFAYDVDFGGGPISSSSPWQLTSIFVAKYSPNGTHLWSASLETGPSADSSGHGIAVDSQNNVLITGNCMEYLNFKGTKLYGHGYNIPEICIAKFSSSGVPLWAKMLGSHDPDYGVSISADNSDNVIVTGSFSGTVDFGGGPLTSGGNSDIFIVKYSPSGNHIWSKRFGSTGSDIGNSIAVDSGNNILLTGLFSGSVNFGGGTFTSAGTDGYVVKFSSSGSHRWSKKLGGSSNDSGNSIAVDSSNSVVVSGYFKGSANFGGSTLTSAGGKDIFVVKYSQSGSHIWSKRFGGSYDQVAESVAVDSGGNIVLSGPFRSSVDFGRGTLHILYLF